MNTLQKDFLQNSISKLENLSRSAGCEETLSPEFLRRTFCLLHTIKGTAQTFGFAIPAQITHEIENLLSASKNQPADFKDVLLEGFALLIKSFEQPDDSPDFQSFSEKIRLIVPDCAPPNSLSSQIPPEISGQISEYEKKAFLCARQNGKNVFRVKADFALADFAAGFKTLKEDLSLSGEIIAALPDSEIAEKGKIGFLIYYASAENIEEIKQKFSAEIIAQSSNFSDDLNGVLSQIAAHGRDLAQKSGKRVEFAISAGEIELSAERKRLIFDILLHLVRNAVDHAIETPPQRAAKGKASSGTIEISLKTNSSGAVLSVADDGTGIDSANIRTKAIEKGLISGERILTESEMLALIFLPELSTRERISELSGRGVGLNAVKSLAENAGGTVGVKSRKAAGTIFEIFLPAEDFDAEKN